MGLSNKYYMIKIVPIFFIMLNTLICQVDLKSESNNTFPSLYMLHPRGTETYYVNEIINIQWQSTGISNLDIEILIGDSEWKTVISNINAKDNSYSLIINDQFPEKIKIRITDSNNSKIFDMTPFFIRIKHNKSLHKIYRPNEKLNTSSIDAIKIMPLGNSITLGYLDPLPLQFDGYRKLLQNKIVNNGFDFDFVGSLSEGTFTDIDHEGHGGWHTDHWANPVRPDILDSVSTFVSREDPDIVLLHIGTNDIGEYDYPTLFNDNTIDTTVTNVSKILDSIYSYNSNILVILAKIVNRTDNLTTSEVNEFDTTSAYNNALEIMANARISSGDKLKIVDMENALSYPGDLSDGVHPSQIGYDKMAVVWFNEIFDNLPKMPPIKMFIEGAYINSSVMSNSVTIPNSQPYNVSPWNYSGSEFVDIIPSGIVDWILISLRENTSSTTNIAQRAGFLKTDGSVVDIDGISQVRFDKVEGDYHVVIEHRNHLKIMSSTKLSITK